MKRRQCLTAALGLPFLLGASDGHATSALHFPRDLGSHPDFAIEWWYLTGQLLAGARAFGFQITFFRSRVPVTQGMRSAFAAKQLIFAHAAVTDVDGKRLLHDQRMARSSASPQVDMAVASTNDTNLKLDNWMLRHEAQGYQARAQGAEFSLALSLHETQEILLQGEHGWSRKGPEENQASYYYSLPQLTAIGTLQLSGKSLSVHGQAWLDHEWSDSLMPPDAVGWDWIGMNLLDGSALTAFRMRNSAGDAVWSGGSFRGGTRTTPENLGTGDVHFTPLRRWKSPDSSANYPVEWALDMTYRTGTGTSTHARFTIQAVINNQELDSRQSTGAVYWEGLSELFDSQGKLVGRGYLEMTGYAKALKL